MFPVFFWYPDGRPRPVPFGPAVRAYRPLPAAAGLSSVLCGRPPSVPFPVWDRAGLDSRGCPPVASRLSSALSEPEKGGGAGALLVLRAVWVSSGSSDYLASWPHSLMYSGGQSVLQNPVIIWDNIHWNRECHQFNLLNFPLNLTSYWYLTTTCLSYK